MKCENCGKILHLKDWPFSFRGLMNLCDICKLKAKNILVKESKNRKQKNDIVCN